MNVTITWQSLVSVVAIITAAIALFKYVRGAVHWMDRQEQQDKEIEAQKKEIERLKKEIAERDEKLRDKIKESEDNSSDAIQGLRRDVNNELTVLCYGTLACLKSISGTGDTDTVNSAIEKLEKHLNQKAHQ